jgi:steroid delta-isomerase-like uncharacterized protein
MTTTTEVIARQFLQAWNAGGEQIVDSLASPDLTVSYTHFPQPLQGAEAFKKALRETHEYFPDLEIIPEEVIATENTAVVRWIYRATHQRGELFGVPPSGKRVDVRGITIYRVEAGLVRSEEGVVDNLSLVSQLRAPSND